MRCYPMINNKYVMKKTVLNPNTLYVLYFACSVETHEYSICLYKQNDRQVFHNNLTFIISVS